MVGLWWSQALVILNYYLWSSLLFCSYNYRMRLVVASSIIIILVVRHSKTTTSKIDWLIDWLVSLFQEPNPKSKVKKLTKAQIAAKVRAEKEAKLEEILVRPVWDSLNKFLPHQPYILRGWILGVDRQWRNDRQSIHAFWWGTYSRN